MKGEGGEVLKEYQIQIKGIEKNIVLLSVKAKLKLTERKSALISLILNICFYGLKQRLGKKLKRHGQKSDVKIQIYMLWMIGDKK